MEKYSRALSTRVKQRVVTEFLTAHKVTPTEINHRLHDVYGNSCKEKT